MKRPTYIVVRAALSEDDEVEGDSDMPFLPRMPVRAFARREEAEALCQALRLRAMRELRPFDVGTTAFVAPDEEEVIKGVERLGLPLLRRSGQSQGARGLGLDLEAWWPRVATQITDEQRAGLWELFEIPPLFEVREMNVE
jgi:hypothetical protein